MSKSVKIWLLTAAALVLIGCIVFACVMAVLEWDFLKLSTRAYEINRYEITEDFSSIVIDIDTTDVIFAPSDGEECFVECYEDTKIKHTALAEDGVLTIAVTDERAWYEYIGIGYGAPRITVYLPEAEYASLKIEGSTSDVLIPNNFRFETVDISVTTGDVECLTSATGAVSISASTGDIRVGYMSAGSLNLAVTTGDLTLKSLIVEGDTLITVTTGRADLSDMTCKNLTSSGDTGDLTMKNVIASGKLKVERSTGDVSLDGFEAAEIFIKTDTGDVEGRLLSDKVFIIKTDTGDVNVPDSAQGGRCEITTSTGDVKIRVRK